MRLLAAAAMLALAACATPQQPTQLTGSWGGPHVGLVFEGGLGKLEYDCASGTIDQAVVPGPDGRFQAEGRHIPGQGGPVRVGQIFRSYRATYSGTVRADVMELRVAPENGEALGPFTLKLGAEPQIFRCL